MPAQSAVMRLHVVRPSVCLSVCRSVTIRYRVQIRWNSSKIISRAIWCNGNTPKLGIGSSYWEQDGKLNFNPYIHRPERHTAEVDIQTT